MSMRNLSHILSRSVLLMAFAGTTLLGMAMDVKVAGAAEAAADVGIAATAGRLPAQPPIVTMGPVYAYGPVVRPQPRQRPQRSTGLARPNWSGRGPNEWRSYPPRNGQYAGQYANGYADWNGGELRLPYGYRRPTYGYPGPYGARPEAPSSLTWYDRQPQRNDGQDRYRPPYRRY